MSNVGRRSALDGDLLIDTAEIVVAHISNSPVESEDLPDLIRAVHQALLEIRDGIATMPLRSPTATPTATYQSQDPPQEPEGVAEEESAFAPMPPNVVQFSARSPRAPDPAAETAPEADTPSPVREDDNILAEPDESSAESQAGMDLLQIPMYLQGEPILLVSNAEQPAPPSVDEPKPTHPIPKVPIEHSVTPNYIICLEDGRECRDLGRRLAQVYGMTPDEYRQKWGLPSDYPMVAPNHIRQKGELSRYDPVTLQRMPSS